MCNTWHLGQASTPRVETPRVETPRVGARWVETIPPSLRFQKSNTLLKLHNFPHAKFQLGTNKLGLVRHFPGKSPSL